MPTRVSLLFFVMPQLRIDQTGDKQCGSSLAC
jgi:hypothetical protein